MSGGASGGSGGSARDEARVRSVVDAAFDAYLALDAQGRVTDCNAEAERLFGWPRAEIAGMSFHALVPDGDAPGEGRPLSRFLSGDDDRRAARFELTAVTREGQACPIALSISSTAHDGTRVFHVFVRDLTPRQRAEAKLRESEARHRAVLDDIHDSYFEVDLRGTYVHVNEAFCRRTGLSLGEIVGRNFRELSFRAPDAVPLLKEVFNKVYRTGLPIRSFEYRSQVLEDGSELFNEISVSLKRDAKGEPVGFVGTSRDAT